MLGCLYLRVNPVAKQSEQPVHFSDKSTLSFIEAREKAFSSFFGEKFTVSHELAPMVPHLDVYIFKPDSDRDRDFFTLVTGGMSDLPMKSPKPLSFPRAELILYVEEPKDDYIALLRWLARLVHDQGTWLSSGSTMTNGQPPRPIFAASRLDCYFFLTPPLEPDNSLPQKLVLENQPVSFLWVIPITSVECDYIRKRGADDFLDILDRKDHPIVLDEERKLYVRARASGEG